MRIRFTLALLSALPFMLLLGERPALAQDEPLIGGETPPPAPAPAPAPAPTPPPPPAPAPAAAPAPQTGGNTPRKLKDITDTDHDMVVKSIGLQVVHMIPGVTFGMPNDPSLSLTEIGVRVWLTRKIGLDAGLGLLIFKAGQDGAPTQVGVGFTGGLPLALGIYRHVTMFAGPELNLGFAHIAENVNPILLTIRGRAGIELHLGFMDIPRVSLTLGFSLGFSMLHVSDNTTIRFGTGDAFSFWGLFETSVGLVFYI